MISLNFQFPGRKRTGHLQNMLIVNCFMRKYTFGQHTETRVATVRENIWKMKFFPGQGKVWEFFGGMAREIYKGLGKSVKLKINSYGRQSSEILFCSRGETKGCTLS